MAAILIIFVIPAYNFAGAQDRSGDEDIYLTGSMTLTGRYANLPAAGSGMENKYLRYRLNTTLHLYGMPVTTQLYLTTEESRGSVNQQRFSVSMNPRMLRNRIPVLSWFTDFTIGRAAPSYSRLTMQGTAVDGFSAEMNPGSVYLAFVTGKMERASERVAFRGGGFDRYVTGGKLGYGDPRRSHVHTVFLRFHDDPGSAVDGQPSAMTPRENYVGGIHGGIDLFSRQFRIEGELAGSIFTRDREEGSLEGLGNLPGWVNDWFSPNLSTSFDYAWNLQSQLNSGDFRMNAGMEQVGPGYRTLGNTRLRNDVFMWNTRLEQRFHNRRVSVSAQARQNRDNVIPWKNASTFTTYLGFGLGLRFPGYPSIQINIAPHFQQNDDRGIDRSSWLYSMTSSYTYRFGDNQSTTSVFLSRQAQKTETELRDFTRHVFSLNQVFTLNRKWILRGTFSWNRTNFETRVLRQASGESGAEFRPGSGYGVSAGLRVSDQRDYGAMYGFYVGGEVDLGFLGTLNVRINQDFFRDDDEGLRDYDRSVYQASLTRRF